MDNKEKTIKNFEDLLKDFSRFIRDGIMKYNLQKNGIDPEDIIQEVRIKLWKISFNGKIIHNYPSYINKIIRTSVIDYLRKLKRDENIYSIEKQKKISEQKCNYKSEKATRKELSYIVGNATNSLIANRKKVVKLFLLNMTIDEIATIFRWSKDKTRNLLYRGLADLKKKIKNKGIHYEDK